MSACQLVVELEDEARERARRVLDACPTVGLGEGVAADARELPAAVLLVIEKGVVALVSGEPDVRRRMVVAIAAPGDVVVPPRRNQVLRALSPAQLTALTTDAERELLRQPAAASAVASALVDAVCDREESLTNFARFPHVERVRAKLMQLARSLGTVRQDGVVIDVPLTHDVIGESVGSTRETVTLAMRTLTRSGVVSRADHRYRVNLSPEQVAAGGLGGENFHELQQPP